MGLEEEDDENPYDLLVSETDFLTSVLAFGVSHI